MKGCLDNQAVKTYQMILLFFFQVRNSINVKLYYIQEIFLYIYEDQVFVTKESKIKYNLQYFCKLFYIFIKRKKQFGKVNFDFDLYHSNKKFVILRRTIVSFDKKNFFRLMIIIIAFWVNLIINLSEYLGKLNIFLVRMMLFKYLSYNYEVFIEEIDFFKWFNHWDLIQFLINIFYMQFIEFSIRMLQKQKGDRPYRSFVPSPVAQFQKNHKKFMPYAWTFVINIAVFFAMYKFKSINIYIHAIISLFVVLVTLITSLPILIENGIPQKENSRNMQRHYIIGFIVMIIIFLEVLMGVISKILQIISWSHPYPIYFLNIAHKYLGYGLIILSKIQVFLTMYPQKDEQNLFWGLIASEIVSVILWIASKLFLPTIQGTTIQQSQSQNLQYVQSLQDVKGVQSKAIFGNLVYNIQPLKHNHPNGFKIIQKINKRQLDRYLYGMYVNQNFPLIPPNSHSFKSMSLLDYPIAQLKIPPLYSGHSKDFDEVNLLEIKKVSDKCSIYQIKLTNKKTDYVFNKYTSSSQLGRFYAVTIDNKITRLYTSVSFLDPSNIKLLKSFIDIQDYSIGVNNFSQNNMVGYESDRQLQLRDHNHISLLFKHYPKGKLTTKLVENNFKTLFLSELRGEGLKFGSTPPGKIIIIAGGTGLLPFSDFIDLVFKNYAANSNPKALSTIHHLNPILKNDPFLNFSFHLFLAADSLEEIHPITLKQIIYLCENKHAFKLTLRVSQLANEFKLKHPIINFTNQRFDQIIIGQMKSQQYSKVWVCGPPKMTQAILHIFKIQMVDDDKILIL